MPSAVSELGIREIWQSNLEEEFKNMRKVVKKYNYIAMVCYDLQISIFAISILISISSVYFVNHFGGGLGLLQVSLVEKTEEGKKQERLVILGILIDIHELSRCASIFKMMGLLSTFSSKLESAIVEKHCRASLCCIIVLSKYMIGYWFFIKGCQLDRILSSL